MSWTQTDLDAIKEAIATGATTVRHDGRLVTYRSLEDMERIRDLILAELGQGPVRRTHMYAGFSKGLT